MDYKKVRLCRIGTCPENCMSRTVSLLGFEWRMLCEQVADRIDAIDVDCICTETGEYHVLPRRIDDRLMDLRRRLEGDVLQRRKFVFPIDSKQ